MKSWTMYLPNNWTVNVQQLPITGHWLADMRLTSAVDPSGSSSKQDVFDDVSDALRFVGYPIDFAGFDIPKELV